MSLLDSRGCPVSTTSTAALQQYERAMELSAGYFLDPLATIQTALDAHPAFAMGHCLRAALMVMATDRNAVPMLAESIEAVEALGRRAHPRERAHAAAARTWLEGDFAGAIRRYGDILLEYPHDLLALQVAHVGDFFLGASSMLRDRVAQVLPAWDPTIPGYGYVLGMYAFGLEEMALYSRAEDIGRRALEANPRDPWAVHAVTHVMEMQGRLRDGIEWITTREKDWAPNNGFAFHNWWHLALFHLDAGNTEEVLALYDRRIRNPGSQAPLEMIDASAMLWRLQLRGVDVGARWQELANSWEPFAEHAYYAFNDCHAVMAFAGAGRLNLAQRTLAAMERRASGSDTNAMMTREVGLPLAHALVSFIAGQPSETVDLLLPIRTSAHRFGGSHAQRDLIAQTLLAAAAGAGPAQTSATQRAVGRALLNERLLAKPSTPLTEFWARRLVVRHTEAA
jgi:tetratricopeptide (TPR) repeat protein